MPETEISLAPVHSLEEANRERRDKPFFRVLPRPQYPDCDHSRRGVELDTVRRVVRCRCGAEIDAFDALLIYARAEQRLVQTREDIERHKEEVARKAREQQERKPFLRQVNGFGMVCNPAPPNGDGAMIGYDVSLSPCGHRVRWPSKGKRRPPRRLTCDVCLRAERAKATRVLK